MSNKASASERPAERPKKDHRGTLKATVSRELVESLEAMFPNTLPLAKVSEHELGVLMGHQEVIRLLRTVLVTNN